MYFLDSFDAEVSELRPGENPDLLVSFTSFHIFCYIYLPVLFAATDAFPQLNSDLHLHYAH